MDIAAAAPSGEQQQEPVLNGSSTTGLEDYARTSFYRFLNSWQEVIPGEQQTQGSQGEQQLIYYHEQIRRLRVEDRHTLMVDWQHLVNWNTTIADIIMAAYFRLEPSLRKAVQSVVREVEPEYAQVSACKSRRGQARMSRMHANCVWDVGPSMRYWQGAG